jgi:hypothetical protein
VFTLSESSTLGEDIGASGAGFSEQPRFSLDNLAYYFWNAANVDYYLPLLTLFAIGLVAALRRWRQPHIPELLLGLAVGYLALTFALSYRDPRYTIPLVVYVAVIGTGWIPALDRRWARIAAVGALLLIVAINVRSVAIHGGPRLKLNLAGEEGLELNDPGSFTIVDDRGFYVGPPIDDDFWQRLLEAARDDGVETARISIRENAMWGTDTVGFGVVASEFGITETSFARPRIRHPDLRINTWYTDDEFFTRRVGLPEPCGKVTEGTRAPQADGPQEVSVAVERRQPDGSYERWCEF